MGEMVKYIGLSKAEVLLALYKKAQPKGLGLFVAGKKELTLEQAEKLLQETTSFDYIDGRPIKVDLSNDEGFDPWLYDRDHGESAGFVAVMDYALEKKIGPGGSNPIIKKETKKSKQNNEIKDATIEHSTKVEQKSNVEEEIKEIDDSIISKEEKGLIPEFKMLKWAEYSTKHPTVTTKKGAVVNKGQFLYIETLKYDWTSKHIHIVSEANKKIEEFNNIVAENGIEDMQLSKIISSIRVFINKNKEVLNDCENFDEVVNAVKQQTKEIKDIKNSTLNQ